MRWLDVSPGVVGWAAACVILFLLASAPARAQGDSAQSATPDGAAADTSLTGSRAGPAPMDTTPPSSGPFSRMRTLFEKTIFKVDVLTLEVGLGEEDTRRLEAIAAGRRYSAQLADTIAEVAIHSQDAWARIVFKRGASLDQFVDGVLDNLKKAREAEIIDAEAYDLVAEGLPRWFAFLAKRRIQKGDQILYRIAGDTLRTQFRAADGEILLDQSDVGSERRLAVLGSYFVRKSDFREGLIKSLFPGE